MSSGPNPSERPRAGGDAPQAAKGRASRLRPDYHRRHDRLWRLKWGLSAAAGVLCLLWLLSGVDFAAVTDGRLASALKPAGRLRATHGPVASVHAAWEQDCEACHVPLRPINAEAWFTSFDADGAHAADKNCLACHAGSHHHANVLGGQQACSACHREHQGRDHDLTAVADAACVACHGDLPSHRTAVAADDASRPKGWDAVTGFPAAHPPFGGGEDPGRLKFNHALHMTAGMGSTKAKGYFRYRDLPEGDRERYLSAAPGDDLDSLVRLDCASCHEADRSEEGGALPGDGRRFLPVSYERHCAACHGTDVALPPGSSGGEPERLKIPHGIEPAEVDQLLTGALAARALDGDPRLVEALDKSRLRSPGADVSPALRELKEEGGRVRAGLAAPEFGLSRLRRVLFEGEQTCGKCHFYEVGGETVETPPTGFDFGDDAEVAKLKITPTAVPAVWYDRAVFDHAAHRAMNCTACHPGAAAPGSGLPPSVPSGGWLSHAKGENLVPGFENCAACHAPAGEGVGGPGGVRNGCVVCHVYHAADRRPAGRPPQKGHADFTSPEAWLRRGSEGGER